ncbi:hypothetical protein [Vibrio parahaemolyticus]|uniref:hypothetical protein n=2 Tax=Vibrio parahaemolyticus TaxID=670 RepID=UPI0023DA6B6E|nr:hypothetical protein [Vibrio parahaemolyticus]EGR3388149.1 methyl-accepting chemotaxis protein [Vibrio parahaemolyticus]EJZ3961933.1 hypothetical protein [Vibrio parahaemolyticus]MDF2280499.1 hypothetical protein [Vibrio parahaemolyticus]MDF2287503.1 hypothetical protein [Vibrio parahaemolyticus]MDF2289259.1 hypothetical protein [Vibrio parahaemolyticus]
MSSSWYRRGTVTVTDGSKEVVGVGTLWVDAGNKPLAGDIMFIAGSIYEVESITDNEHLSLFRPFTGVPPANGEYAIIRNTSVTIATRVAAMVAAAINSKQVLLDDLRGYYTSTADKVLIHTDDGSTIEVVPLQTLVSDITNLIAQSESIKNDLANTQAALDLVRQYSNAAQGVEVEPGKYSAKSYAADAADTLALVNKAKSDVDLKASQVQQTKTDIEQFVSTSKTEIDAKATAISEAIDTQATTVKGEITALTSTSKQEITALATQSKKDITTLTTTSKSEISELVAGGTNSITSLTDTSKGAINTLVSASKTEITELATTEKAAISQQSTTAISEMTSLKQSAEQAASTATQKATQAAASATSAAQSKTDAQTLKTQTEALANETKQVAEEIKSGSYVGWQIYCQSEANMKAQRALASNEFAASGFVHYGKHYNVNSINEGMWKDNGTETNMVWMGFEGDLGTSKTNLPVTNIAGFQSTLNAINENNKRVRIKFPDAPNGTVIYDSTGNCRGSGKATLDLTKDVDPKYGDVASSVNEAVARAFEGYFLNGNFRNNGTGWGAVGWVFNNGTAKNSNTGFGSLEQAINTVVGTQYKISVTVVSWAGQDYTINAGSLGNAGKLTGTGLKEFVFTAKTTRTLIDLRPFTGGQSGHIEISSFSVSPVTEEVVINRVDMFGFEYFLEEISKANPFVYPYGCIQSKLTSIEGIATKESNRPITYYSVFDGDTTSKGKGVDFWAATDAQKRALVSNPDHNIYLLDDGRLVQWRVRQRTIAGAGNGKWADLSLVTGNATLYSTSPILNDCVQAQGSSDSILTPSWARTFVGITHNSANHKQLGVWELTDDTTIAVDGHCYFHVCGVVPRLNQGAYHPSFNPMGAGRSKVGNRFWYSTGAGLNSSLDCFPAGTSTGNITGNASGRPDGKFYDAIYASGQGGVIDYRLPAWDVSSKEEASKIFQKVVNGTYRGEELAVRTWISPAIAQTPSPQATSIATEINTMDLYKVGGKVSLYDIATKQVLVTTTITGIRNGAIDVLDTFNRLAGDAHLVVTIESNIPVSGDFTQVDVIGEPANILTTPALANGWLGGWIPVIPDGSAKQFEYTRKNIRAVGDKTDAVATTTHGQQWGNSSVNTDVNTTNIFGAAGQAITAAHVYVIPCVAFAKQTKVSTNKVVLNQYEGLGLVTEICHSHLSWGVKLAESLMGKVCTSSAASTGGAFHPITRLGWERGAQRLATSVNDPTVHSPITMPAPSNNSPAVKALWYQTADNQQCSLNFAWNELVWKNLIVKDVNTASSPVKQGEVYVIKADVPLKGQIFKANGNNAGWNWSGMYMGDDGEVYYGGGNSVSLDTTVKSYQGKSDGWGDDSTIRIINGIGTFINLNGDTCLYGTHELAIPYGYIKNKARAGSQVSGVDL